MSRYFGIPLRNGLPLGLGTVATLRSGGAASWTPLTLFLAGEQGGWYDPSDLSTMYQDSAGTTPVTAVEQPVGLWLDKRLGALSALGPELVTNGDFATSSWWSLNAGWVIGSGAATHPTGAEGYILSPFGVTTVGKAYRVSVTVASLSGGSILLALGPGSFTTIAAAGSYSFVLTAANDTRIGFYAGTAVSVSIDNVSVREVPGNHLIQPTSASRPTYSKRYNLLERTQEIDNAVWAKTNASVTANAATAPDGTLTADKLIADAALGQHRVNQNTTISATSHTYSVSAKAAEYNFAWLRIGNVGAVFDLSTGAISANNGVTAAATLQTDGWWRLSITCVAAANAVVRINAEPAEFPADYSGNGVSGILIWGADLRRTIHTTMGMPAYQRVTTATNYDESGFLPRLRFDGADDSMYSAASVNFSASDEMTVLAGLTTLGGNGMVLESSIDAAANNGAIVLYDNNSNTRFDWWSRGTVLSQTSAARTAPITRVITGLAKIATDQLLVRSNAVQAGSSTSDQGTGNYGNHLLYVGRRANSSLPFNGDLFQLVVRGALTSGADLTSAEQYVAARTGVAL